MSENQDQSRTEDATPRKRERAREEGQVVFSPDLSAGAMLSIVSLLAFLFTTPLQSVASGILTDTLSEIRVREFSMNESILAGKWLFAHLILIVGTLSLATTGIALLVTQIQSGYTMTVQPLSPKWDKISPWTGWNRLLSVDSLFRGGLSILKLISSLFILLMLSVYAIHDYRASASGLAHASESVEKVLILRLLFCLSGVTLFWGVLDYAMRWYRNEQKMKMSKQEVKDEQKEDQIDPLVRSRMRRTQQEAAKRRSLQDVPKATLVITNPTHYAVAIKYHPGTMTAPVVIAKGTDAFARRIAETARVHGVPVLERKPLTRAIYALSEVGDEIPMDFYRAIAELLAHVYRIKGIVNAHSSN